MIKNLFVNLSSVYNSIGNFWFYIPKEAVSRIFMFYVSLHTIAPLNIKTEADLGLLLEAVNYYHKALHLGCSGSPRSSSVKDV